MNREMNPFEIEQRDKLWDLKAEYLSLKRTAELLQEHKNITEADKMEQKAQGIAAEILKLDPNFAKDLDRIVKDNFELESENLNAMQNEKPDYKN